MGKEVGRNWGGQREGKLYSDSNVWERIYVDYWVVLVDLKPVLVLNPALCPSVHSLLVPPCREVFQLSLVSCCLPSQLLQLTETPHLDAMCSCRSVACLSAEETIENESILNFLFTFHSRQLEVSLSQSSFQPCQVKQGCAQTLQSC